MTTELHSGTVTFLFTDIEGSTQLLRKLGDRYAELVTDQRRLMREAATAAGGLEVDTQGDAFFFAFDRSRDAVEAAADAQRRLRAHEWPDGTQVRVRMGLHTGEPTVGEEGYLGLDVVRAARIASAANGGQILLSETTRALAGRDLPAGLEIDSLGASTLKDLDDEQLFELVVDGDRGGAPRAGASLPAGFGERLAAEIQSEVLREIEQGFGTAGPPRAGRARPGGFGGRIRQLLARRRPP